VRLDQRCSDFPRAARRSSTTGNTRSGGHDRAAHRKFTTFARERLIMSKGTTSKANVKKKGKTLKEKQTAKRVKREEQNGHSSNIPPTGH
jgi:hypothetical protein